MTAADHFRQIIALLWTVAKAHPTMAPRIERTVDHVFALIYEVKEIKMAITLADDDTSQKQQVSTRGVPCPWCSLVQLPKGAPTLDGSCGTFDCEYCDRSVKWSVAVNVVWSSRRP